MKFVGLNTSPVADERIQKDSLVLFGKYYREYYQEKFQDLSFLIIQDSQVLGYVQCCYLEGKLTLPDGGVIIKFVDMSHQDDKELCTKILDHLDGLAAQYNCTSIIIKDRLNEGSLSTLGEQLFNRKFQSRLTFEMDVCYQKFCSTDFYKNLRKSYKSLINWGKNNMDVIHINKDNQSKEEFRLFKEFHYKISGRRTRSDESWDIQYDMIKDGLAELILARHNNALVGGSLFSDYGDTSIYFTGVYERDLFQFGISHFLLYSGICRSFERGNTSKFSNGYFDTDIEDPKWYNIQFFKKGFCQDLNPTIFWSKEIK